MLGLLRLTTPVKMTRVFLALTCLVAVACAYRPRTYRENACTGLPEGSIPAHGCNSYTKCIEEEPHEIECVPQVFNPKTQECDEIENTPPPCGVYHDCTCLDDGQYPNYQDSCKSYYTCKDWDFQGITPCSGGLVYNPELEVCDWEWAVPPPCGTMEVETDAPETEAPPTDAPETEAPETEAPETEAPETEAPETEAPETDAPETDAPETDAPETDAPETDAPETDAPEPEVEDDEDAVPVLY